LLGDLYLRGLRAENLLLIVTDGCAGLAAAIPTVYPRVLHQRCWVHKMQNILEHVRKRDYDDVKRDAQAIYQAENRRQVEAAFCAFRRRWQRHCRPQQVSELCTGQYLLRRSRILTSTLRPFARKQQLGAFLSVRFHFVVFLCRRNQEGAFHFRKEPRWLGLTFAIQCGNEKLNTSLPAATATYCAVSTA
jgi:hypothetical protein